MVVLCFCVGVVGVVALSRSGGAGDTTTRATATTIPLFGASGATQPTTGPRPSTQGGNGGPLPSTAPRPSTQGGTSGGGNGVARGDYRCQAFTTTGLVTVGGLHIISDTLVTYSTDDQPIAGAQQYPYTYDPTTRSIRFLGGPYEGYEGTYDPDKRIIQVSPSVGCAWQR